VRRGAARRPDTFRPEVTEVRLTKRELLDAAGLEPRPARPAEQYGLVAPVPGTSHYDGDSLAIAKTVAEMAAYGIEARHLRPFKAAADREVGLVEQVVMPLAAAQPAGARPGRRGRAGARRAVGPAARALVVRAGPHRAAPVGRRTPDCGDRARGRTMPGVG
jgi:hypothetical protein